MILLISKNFGKGPCKFYFFQKNKYINNQTTLTKSTKTGNNEKYIVNFFNAKFTLVR